MSTEATGYAIITDAGIDVTTVSPTEVGAKVNWLAAACGVMCYSTFTDDKVDQVWKRYAAIATNRPRLATVRITC